MSCALMNNDPLAARHSSPVREMRSAAGIPPCPSVQPLCPSVQEKGNTERREGHREAQRAVAEPLAVGHP
jgi:hypothetical protein